MRLLSLSHHWDSNPEQLVYKTSALPIELWWHGGSSVAQWRGMSSVFPVRGNGAILGAGRRAVKGADGASGEVPALCGRLARSGEILPLPISASLLSPMGLANPARLSRGGFRVISGHCLSSCLPRKKVPARGLAPGNACGCAGRLAQHRQLALHGTEAGLVAIGELAFTRACSDNLSAVVVMVAL